jgi:hypothetical protein
MYGYHFVKLIFFKKKKFLGYFTTLIFVVCQAYFTIPTCQSKYTLPNQQPHIVESPTPHCHG